MESNNRLAQPVIITNPREELAAEDVYKAKATGVITNLRDFASKYGKPLGDWIRTARDQLAEVPRVIESVNRFSKGSLTERLAALQDVAGVSVGYLPENLSKTVEGALTTYGDYYVQIGDTVRLVETTDFKEIRDIGNFINRITGENSFLGIDQDGLAGLTIGLIQEVSDLNLGNAFSTLTQDITDQDLLTKIANGSLEIAVNNADLALLEDVVNRMGTDADKLDPNLIANFLNTYRDTSNGLTGTDLETYQRLIATFDKLNPDWRYAYRLSGDEAVLNVAQLNQASDSFKTLYRDGSLGVIDEPMTPDQALQVMTLLERNRDVDSAIASTFPYFKSIRA